MGDGVLAPAGRLAFEERPRSSSGWARRGGAAARRHAPYRRRLADNPESLGARAGLDRAQERLVSVERRAGLAYAPGPGGDAREIVALGSRVALEDLDDGTREEYVLVAPEESSPAEGRLSNESPVGRAIAGHHRDDVVDVHAPHRIRHIRIAELRSGTRAS